MADYFFLDDGRRVDVASGSVRVFPDGGFNFRESVQVGNIERLGTGRWHLTQKGQDLGNARSKKEAALRLLEAAAEAIAADRRVAEEELERYYEAVLAVRRVLPEFEGSPEWLRPMLAFAPDQVLDLLARLDGRPEG